MVLIFNDFTIVRFVDVMVLNDIIEQAAGRQSETSDHGGKSLYIFNCNNVPKVHIHHRNLLCP